MSLYVMLTLCLSASTLTCEADGGHGSQTLPAQQRQAQHAWLKSSGSIAHGSTSRTAFQADSQPLHVLPSLQQRVLFFLIC